ncbi:O-linked N-acetylglucosamine transferase, SPINDLY family protein [Phenylobacterium ferrooxidans]|uniref:protein O-GlcNAc transferase n=1 Tax=Phenylobacterium ferrooxidans TaxID=2982689 RepID=A0ABW6CW52_9CAUL
MTKEASLAAEESARANFTEAVRLHGLGRLDEAEPLYRAVLAHAPGQAHSLYNLGLLRRARGDHEGAITLWRTCLTHNPDHIVAGNAMGKALSMFGRLAEALAAFDATLQVAPRNIDALNCRGNILARIGRHAEALECYEQVVSLDPDYTLAVVNRANVLGTLGRAEEAVAAYRAGLRVAPDNAEIQGAKLFQQLQICDWSEYQVSSDLIVGLLSQGVAADLPFTLLAHCDAPVTQIAAANLHLKTRFPVPLRKLWSGEAYAHDRIRVAYVSADFRNHAVAHLIAGLFERHDRDRFEISAYALGPRVEDKKRARIRAAFPVFHDVAETGDLEVAQMIRAAEADIVVDLTGFTANCRPGIFAHRPAPIQINYLGHPGTMGRGLLDYVLGDGVVIPPGAEAGFGEQVIRLPHSYQVNDRDRVIAPRTPTRSEAGLPGDGFVFVCFNANYKINPPVFDVWMRLLLQTPGSVLWLLGGREAAVRNLRSEARARGVDPNRLIFAPKAAPEDHLARHRLADLFLDTLPYNAHTTASDALWTGLPLVTCVGRTFAARVAASLLQAAGLPELITKDLAAYEALALALARDPERLAALKAKLAAGLATAPLFDTDLSRRHIEAAYTIAWERHQRGEPPAAFDVPA